MTFHGYIARWGEEFKNKNESNHAESAYKLLQCYQDSEGTVESETTYLLALEGTQRVLEAMRLETYVSNVFNAMRVQYDRVLCVYTPNKYQVQTLKKNGMSVGLIDTNGWMASEVEHYNKTYQELELHTDGAWIAPNGLMVSNSRGYKLMYHTQYSHQSGAIHIVNELLGLDNVDLWENCNEQAFLIGAGWMRVDYHSTTIVKRITPAQKAILDKIEKTEFFKKMNDEEFLGGGLYCNELDVDEESNMEDFDIMMKRDSKKVYRQVMNEVLHG